MTDSHPAILLICTHVPEELEGVPVPLEIVSAAGITRRVVLLPSEGVPRREIVAAPGRYFVRAELPSGQWIGETAVVEEGRGEAEVTLDFGAEEIPVDIPIRTRSAYRGEERLATRSFSVSPPAIRRGGGQALAAPVSEEVPISLEYGFFQSWLADPSSTGFPPSDRLVVQWLGNGHTLLPGRFTLPEHPGAGLDTVLWRPLLVRLKSFDSEEMLIVWPPSPGPQSLDLAPGTDSNPRVPPVLASWISGDRRADALFSYVRGEAIQAARASAPEPAVLAERFIDLKLENPVHATLAAYALLKIGHKHLDLWMSNLGGWFHSLPDGAIIHGWFLIRAGQADQARDAFQAALARGLPMYSEGVRLLREGLGFLHGLHPEDLRIKADAERADRIASVANLDSELTCLRPGRGLALA